VNPCDVLHGGKRPEPHAGYDRRPPCGEARAERGAQHASKWVTRGLAGGKVLCSPLATGRLG
jgi:hypothetical protein